jgi:hypothetical protein
VAIEIDSPAEITDHAAHPTIAPPPPPGSRSHGSGLDRITFGVTAVVALAFVAWGIADDEQPEFKTVSWVAMMFSAGMGIGLMFFGVSEPLSHFTSPPPGTVEAGSSEALQTAMATTLFHWTLHPWAMAVEAAVIEGVSTHGEDFSLVVKSPDDQLALRGREGG